MLGVESSVTGDTRIRSTVGSTRRSSVAIVAPRGVFIAASQRTTRTCTPLLLSRAMAGKQQTVDFLCGLVFLFYHVHCRSPYFVRQVQRRHPASSRRVGGHGNRRLQAGRHRVFRQQVLVSSSPQDRVLYAVSDSPPAARVSPRAAKEKLVNHQNAPQYPTFV